MTYEMEGYPFQNYDPVDWALNDHVNGTNNSSWVSMWWNITSTYAVKAKLRLIRNVSYHFANVHFSVSHAVQS